MIKVVVKIVMKIKPITTPLMMVGVSDMTNKKTMIADEKRTMS